jgi:hypothetical protein
MKKLFVLYTVATDKLQKLPKLKEAATKGKETMVNHDRTDFG